MVYYLTVLHSVWSIRVIVVTYVVLMYIVVFESSRYNIVRRFAIRHF